MTTFDLDHVALAARDTSAALRFLTGELGGTVIFGGQSIGFRPMQVWIGTRDGDGMSIELIEPWDVERNDFLARFIARHGDGPHHLTFKVDDLAAALERVRAAGAAPVKIDVSDPEWKEAFLTPRDAFGTVVQLAESHGEPGSRAELLASVAANGPHAHPRWWVEPRASKASPARLRRVVVRAPDLASARAFFCDALGGEVERARDGLVDVVWPRGARLRIELRPGAPAGIDRLEVDGLDAPRVLIGTRFAPTPGRDSPTRVASSPT